jgi:small subunit ribosomal protein S17
MAEEEKDIQAEETEAPEETPEAEAPAEETAEVPADESAPEIAEPVAEEPAPEPEAAEEPAAEAEPAEEGAAEAEAEEPAAEAQPAQEPEPAAEEEPSAEAEAEPEAEPAAEAESAAEVEPAAEPALAAEPKRKKKRLPRALRPQRTRPKRELSTERKPIVRLPKPEHERGRTQERRGVVVSDAMDKTIVVKVDVIKTHPRYKKVIRRSRKFHAHDEQNQAKVGDVVRIVETRPLSRTKNWRLAEVLEEAK